MALIYELEELSQYYPDAYPLTIKLPTIFCVFLINDLDAKISDWEINEKSWKERIKQEVHKNLISSFQNSARCQAKCPKCKSRCIRTANGHIDHSTQYYILPAFQGWKNLDSKKTPLNCCFDPKNNQVKGFWGKRDGNHEELYSSSGEWHQDFPSKERFKAGWLPISEEMKECWVGTKDIFIKHWGYSQDSTPQDWLSKVPSNKRLRADIMIENYLHPTKKK